MELLTALSDLEHKARNDPRQMYTHSLINTVYFPPNPIVWGEFREVTLSTLAAAANTGSAPATLARGQGGIPHQYVLCLLSLSFCQTKLYIPGVQEL